jgi:hypothetical protein
LGTLSSGLLVHLIISEGGIDMDPVTIATIATITVGTPTALLGAADLGKRGKQRWNDWWKRRQLVAGPKELRDFYVKITHACEVCYRRSWIGNNQIANRQGASGYQPNSP